MPKSLFSDNYSQARSRFIEACSRAEAELQQCRLDTEKGITGESLTIDIARFGPRHAKKILFCTSGTHGQEGFTGSAIQLSWVKEEKYRDIGPDTAVVFIHAVNPYGFAHLSRTNENNVDLNRNFIDHNSHNPKDELYQELHPIICPAELSTQGLEKITAGIMQLMQKHGPAELSNALTKGQYSHPSGLNYGGVEEQWSAHQIKEIVMQHASGAELVAFIDWHTGLGPRGEPFFLCFNAPESELYNKVSSWWGLDKAQDDEGFGDGQRPDYSGLLFTGIQQVLAPITVAGGVIEFGTQSNAEMLTALIIDRWLRFGVHSDDDIKSNFKAQMLEAFSPIDDSWRNRVLPAAAAIIEKTLIGLENS